jgi:hypothetical protein
MPADSDPHDVLRSEGNASLTARIDEASDYLGFLIDDVDPNELGINSTVRSERVSQILDVIRSIPDRVVRHSECVTLAAKIGIPLEVLWQKVRPVGPVTSKIQPSEALGTVWNPSLLSSSAPAGWDRRLLQILVQDSEFNAFIFRELDETFLDNSQTRRIFAELKQLASHGRAVDFHRQIADLSEEDKGLLLSLVTKDDPPPTERGASDVVNRLKVQHLAGQTNAIQRQIELAEPQSVEQTELVVKKMEISDQLKLLNAALRSKGRHVGN